MARPRPAPRYDVHPSVAYQAAILERLPETTGRSLDDWLALIARKGPKDGPEIRSWLKSAHALGSTTASVLALRASGNEEEYDPEALVEAMFAGPKAALRPLFERLLELGRSMGPDVRVRPCKTIVPLYRQHVFAEIKPTTRTRIDLGFALGNTKPTGRLIATGGFEKKDRITHRISITGPDEIDAQVGRWMRTAYGRDA